VATYRVAQDLDHYLDLVGWFDGQSCLTWIYSISLADMAARFGASLVPAVGMTRSEIEEKVAMKAGARSGPQRLSISELPMPYCESGKANGPLGKCYMH